MRARQVIDIQQLRPGGPPCTDPGPNPSLRHPHPRPCPNRTQSSCMPDHSCPRATPLAIRSSDSPSVTDCHNPHSYGAGHGRLGSSSPAPFGHHVLRVRRNPQTAYVATGCERIWSILRNRAYYHQARMCQRPAPSASEPAMVHECFSTQHDIPEQSGTTGCGNPARGPCPPTGTIRTPAPGWGRRIHFAPGTVPSHPFPSCGAASASAGFSHWEAARLMVRTPAQREAWSSASGLVGTRVPVHWTCGGASRDQALAD